MIKTNGFFKGLYQNEEMKSTNVKVGIHELYINKQFIWQQPNIVIHPVRCCLIASYVSGKRSENYISAESY